MKVAMIGQKGIPSVYGGVETHVENLAAALVERGHDVSVYCRAHYTLYRAPTYRRVRLLKKWSVDSKHFDTITHTLHCSLHALFCGYDAIHYHGIGPASLCWMTRLARRPTVATVHALDWRQRKWNWLAKRYLKFGEWVAARAPHETIVISHGLADYMARRHGRATHHIPNGVAPPLFAEPSLIAERYGLAKNGYVLCVGRLIPDRGYHLMIEAFKEVKSDLRLVIVGGASYDNYYERELRAMLDPERMIMTGYQSGRILAEFYSNAFAFVNPSLVEGMSIALLEALSYGLPTVVSDIPENREVVEPAGGEPIARTFRSEDVGDLREVLQATINRADESRALGEQAARFVLEQYGWPRIAEQTEAVYEAARRRTGCQPVRA
jgi:glycosyltransferase involved in cell wall biosynthesis